MQRRGRRPLRARRGLGLIAAALALACSAQAPDQPDLFLITVDALATDRLGCFDGPPDAAPTLCALGRGGHLQRWAVADAWGEASAAASILSGRSPRDHGVRDQGPRFLSERIPTVAERLAQAGYATAAFVASPRLNRSRRLDQGFSTYDDRIPAESSGDPSALARRVDEWLGQHPAPHFVWIHASRAGGVAALDRLVAGLDRHLHPESHRAPGVVFVALRGEAPETPAASPTTPTSQDGRDAAGQHLGEAISWRRHRVPLIWRAPGASEDLAARVEPGLATLVDVAATLLDAAGLPPEPAVPGLAPFAGRPLGPVGPVGQSTDSAPEAVRRVLLSSRPFSTGGRNAPDLEVGLATPDALYVRGASLVDGSGAPLSTSELRAKGARFAPLPAPAALGDAAPRSAGLAAPAWRDDVLDASSPVPALEVHLARALRAEPHAAEEAP